MTDNEKSRLTLYVDQNVKDELKKQAREHGVSASAYVSMIVMQARDKRQGAGND
jgi:hypothetical protein